MSWKIHSSRWLVGLLGIVYFLALVACFLSAIVFILKLGLALLILLQGFQTWHNIAKIWQLNFDEAKEWQILESSVLQSIKILPSTVISTRFIFLHYQVNQKKFYRLIFKDALLFGINDYRQLLVTLKTYH